MSNFDKLNFGKNLYIIKLINNKTFYHQGQKITRNFLTGYKLATYSEHLPFYNGRFTLVNYDPTLPRHGNEHVASYTPFSSISNQTWLNSKGVKKWENLLNGFKADDERLFDVRNLYVVQIQNAINVQRRNGDIAVISELGKYKIVRKFDNEFVSLENNEILNSNFMTLSYKGEQFVDSKPSPLSLYYPKDYITFNQAMAIEENFNRGAFEQKERYL